MSILERLTCETADLGEENVKKLLALFPECACEQGQVDFDKLRQVLSSHVLEGDVERYQFTWPGKRAAMAEANRKTNKTFRPDREASVNFDTTENLYIEGDNLEALKLLQSAYAGKVKMIYIDPPYNTGNDFVYRDHFSLTQKMVEDSAGVFDEEGNRYEKNDSYDARYHSNWCNMIYSRIKLARELLSDDGVIFISIDDNEVDSLKKICSELFGESNFIGCAGRITKKSNNKGDFWAPNFDYLITYAKNRDSARPFLGEANTAAYNLVDEDGPRAGEKYQLVRLYMSSLQNRNPEQRFWITCPDGSKIIPPGKTFPPERPILGDGIWRWSKSTYEANIDKIVIKEVKSSNLIDENGHPAKWNVFTKTYLKDVVDKASAKPNSFIENHINQIASHELNALKIPFDYAKPTSLIKYLCQVAQIEEGDIVLDFFSGSASTADAVMQLNITNSLKAKFIMVQLPEPTEEKHEAYKAGYKNICEIGKERIRRAGKKIQEEHPLTTQQLDVGFRVLKIDSPSINDVSKPVGEIAQAELFETERIKVDRSSEDLLFQVLLQTQIPLSEKIEREMICGNEVFWVGGVMVACLDKQAKLTEDFFTALAERQPAMAFFRDDTFVDDSARTNLEQIFKQFSKDTKIKVL